MPRIARIKHNNAVYHIMVRGNNKQDIFFNDNDRIRYLETLKRYKEKYQVKVYAYCLMNNHIHLIIDSNGQDISKIMQGINLSYTQYINRTYDRCGHLFQGRFKSEIIDTDEYIIQASRYIHKNPVRAGITKKVEDYEWSSFNIYMRKRDEFEIIEEQFILGYFSKDIPRATRLYKEYVDENDEILSGVERDKYESSGKKVEVKGCSINAVLKKVSACFGVCTNDITLKYNKRYAKIKQIATYLVSLKSKLTYKEIGKKFGVCDSAIAQNIKKAVELIIKDNEQRRYFELILQS